jgi:hypothetical protein
LPRNVAARFFTVRDQEKSKDLCVRILGGEVIKAKKALLYIKLANTGIILNSGGGPPPDKPGFFSKHPRISTE